ncbi:Uncharacterised protein [Streptococcus pneumoniae]|nr:Uncharacterised protein [Streptococcus pneumoniae]
MVGDVSQRFVRTWVSLWIQAFLTRKSLCHSIFSLSSRNSGLRRATNSTSVLKWIRKTVSGASWLIKKTSNVLLVLLTTTCRTKTGQPLFTVSSCQELLFTYQKIICLVLFILASVTQSHVWGKY